MTIQLIVSWHKVIRYGKSRPIQERWIDIWQPDAYLDNTDLLYSGDTLKRGILGGTPRVLVRRGDWEV